MQATYNTVGMNIRQSLIVHKSQSCHVAFKGLGNCCKSVERSVFSAEELELLAHFKQKYNIKAQKPVQWVIKRGLDYAGATVGLIVASPIMLLEAIAIKAESKGPVLFKQVRLGKDGKPFTIYKFRTMYDSAPKTYFNLNSSNCSHITKVGKILRKFSIDELPQFVNILKGDMSLIGPRPTIPSDRLMLELDSASVRRYVVRPGARLDYKGLKNEDLNNKILTEREYLSNWSLKKEAKIFIGIVKDMVTGNNY